MKKYAHVKRRKIRTVMVEKKFSMSIFPYHNLASLWNSRNKFFSFGIFFHSVQGSSVLTCVKLYFWSIESHFFDCSDYVKHFRLEFNALLIWIFTIFPPSPLRSLVKIRFFFFLHTLNNFPFESKPFFILSFTT